ncbi:hypothetical protein [Streptococcus equi]|uniref:hypothetical protein n=1 Tax=Streptococcus equi TaxID=1336 RepID=UPI002659AD57|nr:hypothetical protein [Streptococcus equi]WKF66065.1 hypothetical protein QYM01_07470 [Streptococcus equi subsp. zooepidemicus]
MKMKKKLVMSLIVSLPLLSLILVNNVRAEINLGNYAELGLGYYGGDDPNEPIGNPLIWGFRSNWQQARDFGVKPITEGDDKITVKTIPNAILRVQYQKKDEPIEKEIQQKREWNSKENKWQANSYALANGIGLATFYLDNNCKPRNGDTYKLTLTIDGFYLASGKWIEESEPRDVTEEKERKKLEEDKQYEKEIQTIEEELEKQEQEREALEMFQKQQQEEANKTWYQRLGDNIEDTWANVKDWWKG